VVRAVAVRVLGIRQVLLVGDHQKWYCPCGRHIAVIVEARIVSPGVVRDTIKKLACLPEGWLR
jgi:hypothetical protein